MQYLIYSKINKLCKDSSPTSYTFLFFLYRAKKRKKYTNVIARFRGLNAKNRAPEKLIARSEARFHCILPVFRPKCTKKPLLPWQTKARAFPLSRFRCHRMCVIYLNNL